MKAGERFEVTRSPQEWRRILSPQAYAVLREADTERAGAMVSFAALTGSVIVAEGVEREGERKVLEDLGSLYGQAGCSASPCRW